MRQVRRLKSRAVREAKSALIDLTPRGVRDLRGLRGVRRSGGTLVCWWLVGGGRRWEDGRARTDNEPIALSLSSYFYISSKATRDQMSNNVSVPVFG
jgi:hypothetical protein